MSINWKGRGISLFFLLPKICRWQVRSVLAVCWTLAGDKNSSIVCVPEGQTAKWKTEFLGCQNKHTYTGKLLKHVQLSDRFFSISHPTWIFISFKIQIAVFLVHRCPLHYKLCFWLQHPWHQPKLSQIADEECNINNKRSWEQLCQLLCRRRAAVVWIRSMHNYTQLIKASKTKKAWLRSMWTFLLSMLTDVMLANTE